MKKRLLSMVLALVMLLTMLPILPAEVKATDTATSVQTNVTEIEGTNSFGALLSEDIQEQQETGNSGSIGYSVVSLLVEDGVATVEYDTLEEAFLVVSLYTEDGLQLLVSGKAVVQPEETVAVITLEGEIPEYFMASAYLLDTYDYSPLCASYDTPMYTKEMQELLASTTDDYDADKVLNLDDDKTTNFAVYADTTKVLEYAEGVNTVISADDETATYIIENADEYITGLQVGDVLAYPYGEDQILIVKVATIAVDGTTATITGDELEMEEVFSYAKIEKTGNASDVTVDDSALDEGVVFDGLTQEGIQTYGLRNMQGEGSIKNYLNYKLDKKIKSESDYTEVSVTLKGSLGLELDIDISYYISMTRQFMKFETDVGLKLALSVSGKAEATIPLGDLSVMFFGVSIGFEPEVQLLLQGKVEYSLMAGFTIGYIYDNYVGLLHLNTTPKVESDFKIEASIFIGIDMAPKIDILKGVIAEAKLKAPIGLELKAKLKGTLMGESATQGDRIHACEKCMEMELNFKVEFSAKLKFLKCKWLTLETKVKAVEIKIGEYYWSLDNSEFGEGNCPYVKHRVTVQVKTSNEQNAAGAEIIATPRELQTEIDLGQTNSSGVLTAYLQSGTYILRTIAEGETFEKTVTVKEACKVTLDKDSIGNAPAFISGIDPDSITDYGSVAASGECGTEGNNVTWSLYSGGLLKIQGIGAMKDFEIYHTPWYSNRESIKSILIENGVTSIGSNAFCNCVNLCNVTISDSVVSIGKAAFSACSSLASINIPNGVNTIDAEVFIHCGSLSSVVIPDGVTTIASSAFSNCFSLTSITLPSSIIEIDSAVFAGLPSLTCIWVDGDNPNYCSDSQGVLWNKEKTKLIFVPGTISGTYTIPNGVTSIGAYAFYECRGLTSITIPDSVTSIGAYAFLDCSGLTSITIPDGVTSIGAYAFLDCSGLTSVSIPNGVTTIGSSTFFGCSNLTSITIPDSVTAIGGAAFQDCTSLTNVTIPDSITIIQGSLFRGCRSLTSITIPDSVRRIDYQAFHGCSSLTDVYYGGSELQWGEIDVASRNTDLVYAMIHYNSGSDLPLVQVAVVPEITENSWTDARTFQTANQDTPVLFSMYDGEYGTEITDTYVLKTASFSGLVAGEEYVMLSLVSIEAVDVLAPDNMLYIDQATAAEDGTLTFTYAQREATDLSYVIACGASHNDIKDAVITFPQMVAGTETQTVDPTVVHDGNTLVEGVDYVIVGTVEYTIAGEYRCYIRGIYNYTGLIECTYKVIDGNGWINDDGKWYYYQNGIMQIGWQKIEDALYYFDSSGVMATGVVNIDGIHHKFDDSGKWLNSDHYYVNGKCEYCGQFDVTQIKLSNAAPTLYDNIAMNYKADKSWFDELSIQDPYLVVSFNGVKTTITDYTVNTDGQYVFTFYNIAPNQMDETLTATLYATYGGEVYEGATLQYSVATYCYRMLSNSAVVNNADYAELRTLLVDLLRYGAMAQRFTGFTGQTVDARLTEKQASWGSDGELTLESETKTNYATVSNPTASWTNVGLVLEDAVTMRFKFSAAGAEGLTVKITSDTNQEGWTISGKDIQYEESTSRYYVDFGGFHAGQMRECVYVTVYSGDTAVSNTLRYTIESYAYKYQNIDHTAYPYLAELVKAMMRYGDAAYHFAN